MMGIRAGIEKMKKLTLEGRDDYLKKCYQRVDESFNTKKASFPPEVLALIDDCGRQRELQNIHWTKCNFDAVKEVPEVVIYGFGAEGNEMIGTKIINYSDKIHHFYIGWQLDIIKCGLFVDVSDEQA